MVRLADWPRSPYLNDELREWVRLHLDALGVEDVAVYATASGREDDERRILVATEVGLLDGWYAPRQSTARYSLSIRLFAWQAVHGVDLRGETYRLWAHEHQSRWRLRLARPAFDAVADTPELGRALTQLAAACAVMAEPMGQAGEEGSTGDGRRAAQPVSEAAPFATPAADAAAGDQSRGEPGEASEPTSSAATPLPRPPIRVEPEMEREPVPEDARALDIARRLGLR
jgi:hypothetical protein